MGWHIYEKLLEKVANYSPFAGKVWIVFIFIFRLVTLVSLTHTLTFFLFVFYVKKELRFLFLVEFIKTVFFLSL